MANRRPPAGRSPNVAREPGRKRREVKAIIADALPAEDDPTVEIDATTGQISRKNDDGSITLGLPEKPRKPFRGDKFDANLADDPDVASLLPSIAARLLEGIESDEQNRREWVATGAKGIDLMGVKIEQPSVEVGVDGTISKIKHTGLKRAVMTSWSNSRSELLPVNGPVKVRDDSDSEEEEIAAGEAPAPDLTNVVQMLGIAPPTPPGIAPPQLQQQGYAPGKPGKAERRKALADSLERDFNHYLTVTDKEYYPDFSRMLMSRALLGCQFRKVYRDPILRRPVSRWVKGTSLIVSSEATSLSGAARITEEIKMRQPLVKRLMKIGYWRDVQLTLPTTQLNPMDKKIAQSEGINPMPLLTEDQQHTIYECYAELDAGKLARDETGKDVGYPLPYRITMDKESRQVVEIRRNWKKGDEDHRARIRYVKYGFVPSLGFYDWGFVHLIGDPQRGATMIEQALIDAGMLASFPGGVMAKSPGTRQRTSQVRPGLGQFIVMDTGGLPVDQFIMPWPYKEPSTVLAAMGQDLAAQMNAVAGVAELPVGEGRIGNTPVGTIMAYIETVTKVPSAIHKDDHIAQQEEFEKLKELFAEDPESLWRGRKKPARKWEAAEEIIDQDLVPAADPNVPSQTHRLMQVNMLRDLSGAPQFAGIANQRAIWEIAVRTIGFSNTGEVTLPEQPAAAPPPDPKILAAQIKAASTEKSDQAKIAAQQLKGQSSKELQELKNRDDQAERESEERRAMIKAEADGKDAEVKRHHDLLKHGVDTMADVTKHREGLDHERDKVALDYLSTAQAAVQPPGGGGDGPSGVTP